MKSQKYLEDKARNFLRQGDFPKAINLLNDLLVIDKDNLAYLMMRGEALLRQESFEEALSDYAKVVEAEPGNVDALNNFAVALIRCNRQSEAEKIFEYVLELQPDNFDAHINLCNVYQSTRQPEKSLRVAFRAVELNSKSAVAFNNLGTALGDLLLTEESRQAFLTSLALSEKYIPALINLAQVEEKLENRLESMRLYEKILTMRELTPGQIEFIKYYLSYSYLYFGRLQEGWLNYEYGFGALLPIESLRSLRKFTQPKWSGEEITGKRILVWGEQGLGDEIMFGTCINEVVKQNCSVIIECDFRLISAFQRSFPKCEVRAPLVNADRYSAINDFDLHCPFGSLPRLFRRKVEDFNISHNLFRASQDEVSLFQAQMRSFQGKKLVGICWRSGLLSAARNLNYTALSDWSPLLSDSRFQFVNLQYGECEAELLEVEQKLGISILRW